jgi:putative ABC transport system permease protein
MLMVRGPTDASAITALIREQVRALDPDLPVYRIRRLDAFMAQSRWGHRVFGLMLAIFAGIAVLLAAIGLYAVTAYGVAERTAELGLRMALGAQARQLVWMFLSRTMAQLATGVAIGLGGAYAVGQLVRSMLVQTSATDPATLLGTAGLLVVVSIAACLWPARRATRLDPVATLRCE